METKDLIIAAYPPMVFHPDIHMPVDKVVLQKFCWDFGLDIAKVVDCLKGLQKTHHRWRFEVRRKSTQPPGWMNYMEYGVDGLIETEVEEEK